MKALHFDKTGSLDHLVIRELPRPVPAEGEALVAIKAAAINPSDPKNVLGKMSESRPPRIPGRDFAGVVVEGPTIWRGKEVLGTGGNLGFGRDGTHAEFAVIPVDALIEKPAGLGFAQAAALGLAYLTAWSAVVSAGQISPADTVLVLGATGAVGSSAVKIAKHLGAKRVLGTIRSSSDRTRTDGIPATDWIALDEIDLATAVRQLTDGRGVDLVVDVVGGTMFETVNSCLAHRGRHVVIASNPAQVAFNLVDFYHREARLIGVDSLKLSFAESASILREILPLIERGVLTIPVIQPIRLEQARAAYEAVLGGTAPAKQVICFDLPLRQ